MSWFKKLLGLEPGAAAPAEAPGPARAASSAGMTSAAVSLAGEHVLVADASQTIQKVLQLLLEGEGCRITVASTVKDAITALAQAPTVVLVAAQLSDEDGLSVCEAVRRRPELAGAIVLVLRGAFEAPLDEARVRIAGAEGVVVKPFEPAALIDQLRALRARRAPSRRGP